MTGDRSSAPPAHEDPVALETERLVLRPLHIGDAAFILRLLNDPGWLRHIGDKQVRTLADARHYVETGPKAMYARHGHGLLLVERKRDAAPLGVCGLIKRDALEDVDLGFALLPDFRGAGYAVEAAAATLAHARDALGLARVVAIATRDNDASRRLVERLGLRFERTVRLAGDDEILDLFATGT